MCRKIIHSILSHIFYYFLVLASETDNMSAKRLCRDRLPGIYQKFHITDATVKLLKDEGYTSVGLLRNIEAAGPEAVNDIPGLRGAQKMAVRAMLKSLTADDEANSSGNIDMYSLTSVPDHLSKRTTSGLGPLLSSCFQLT